MAVQNIAGEIPIFLERRGTIGGAIERHHMKKTLHCDKIGRDFLLAYDESKRMLVVCATEKVRALSYCENLSSAQNTIIVDSTYLHV